MFFKKKNNLASDDTVLHKSKFLTLLHLFGPPLTPPPTKNKKKVLGTAVFTVRVFAAEIAACITSLLSTCRHFARKHLAERKGRNSLPVLAKNFQLIHLLKYWISEDIEFFCFSLRILYSNISTGVSCFSLSILLRKIFIEISYFSPILLLSKFNTDSLSLNPIPRIEINSDLPDLN